MPDKAPPPLARKAWATFALTTAVNALAVGGLFLYSRTIYIDHLIDGLAEAGMPDAGVQETLVDRLEASLPRLAGALEDRSAPETQRLRAASILGATQDARAIEPLAAALGDPSPTIRAAAVHGLSVLPFEAAAAALAPAVDDADVAVRRELARRLEGPLFYRRPTPPAIELLVRLATDPDPEVERRTRAYLERLAADPDESLAGPARRALDR